MATYRALQRFYYRRRLLPVSPETAAVLRAADVRDLVKVEPGEIIELPDETAASALRKGFVQHG